VKVRAAERRQPGAGGNRIGLRVLRAPLLQWTVDGVAEEVERREVQQDRRQNLGRVAPEAE